MVRAYEGKVWVCDRCGTTHLNKDSAEKCCDASFQTAFPSLTNLHFNPHSSLPTEKPINAYFEKDIQEKCIDIERAREALRPLIREVELAIERNMDLRITVAYGMRLRTQLKELGI